MDLTIVGLGFAIMIGVCSVIFMVLVLIVFIVTEVKESLRYRRTKKTKKKFSNEQTDFFNIVQEIMNDPR